MQVQLSQNVLSGKAPARIVPFIRKRSHKGNTALLLSGTSVLVTADTDKGQIADVLFATDLACKVSKAFCHKAEFKERGSYKLWKRMEAGLLP